ncbi:sulfonate ABC transporter substrate-binding protein [Enterococcus florum]|uniref:Sulfonate ABC transporter substrate-binding protein n=1 Tax=Enterococcus florum TaxID=2480627 RepID=A0A4P5PGP9_9ENTE|nr:ABC transporter substrate-binding protein [Enterococcus florum]GCF92673.1 sulfonate ABC transporter substrate-binding protein [Enterococcus florum]
MKKRMSLFMMVCVLVLFLTGCGGNDGGAAEKSSESSSEEPIKIGVSAFPGWYTWYAVQGFGAFEENKVDVELVWFNTYSDSLQAFNSGQIDAVCAALSDTISPALSDVDFKVVLINDNSAGADGIVAQLEIKSLKDLKGKTVATEIGTIEHFFLLNALETVGLTEADIDLTNMTVENAGPAVISGQVDAASLWEPSLSYAASEGDTNLLFDSSEIPGLIPDTLMVSGKLLKEHSDDVQKIVQAYFDGMQQYVEKPDEALGYMAKQADISVEEMKTAMAGARLFSIADNHAAFHETAENYSYLPYTAEKTAKFLLDQKMVSSELEDPEQIFDSSYIDKLYEESPDKKVPNTQAD